MQILFNGLQRPKRAAQNLKRACGIKLSQAHRIVARISGYRDWHHMERAGLSAIPTPLDPHTSLEARDQRRAKLILRMQNERGCSFMEAARGVLCAQLLHDNREDPWRHAREDGDFTLGQTITVHEEGGNPFEAVVLNAERGVIALSAAGGVIYRGREEVCESVAKEEFPLPLRLWAPYGVWEEASGSKVLFSRDYCPIWRVSADGLIEQVEPFEWIDYQSQRWFWNDATRAAGEAARVAEASSFLKSFGVEGEPLLKWAIIPLMFGGWNKTIKGVVQDLEQSRPWLV